MKCKKVKMYSFSDSIKRYSNLKCKLMEIESVTLRCYRDSYYNKLVDNQLKLKYNNYE